MTLVFDTLSYARKLRDAGFTEAQARAQAEALAEIASENLATKSDIAALQRDTKEMETRLRVEIEGIRRDIKELDVGLRRDMKEMETRLQAEIAAVRREIAAAADKVMIRLGGLVVVGVVVLAALMRLP